MRDKCEICNEHVFKYKCPRCGVKTCSLPCVKTHKTQTECSGQRDKTAYVPIRGFTDIHLLSDYRFLEDAGRKTNSTTRDPLRRQHFKPNFLKELEKQASKREINLRIMPYPMSRRKNNFTTYNYKSKCILWHIEWQFPQSSLVLNDKRLEEHSSLETCLNKHIGPESDPIVKHKLKPYITEGTENWGLFIKKEGIPNKRYYRLDIKETITNNFQNKTLIEYPVIYVVLKSHWSEYKIEEEKTIKSESQPVIVNTPDTNINTERTQCQAIG